LSLKDPLALFQSWLQEAIDSGIKEPTAMTVATVDVEGGPDARMLLLKGCDERGFVFYTNLESRKAQALRKDPRVALCFFWATLEKQVRIRGRTALVSEEEADAYFASRPRLSQISAWASKQSQSMGGYFELEAAVAKTALRFGAGTIPRPPFWSGFRVAPEEMEFWHGKPYRRHHRILYVRTADSWQTQFLYP
jgi:pyridoxamine 5'-phosphate oxidase